ncbi:hypothetical protein EVG20_g8344 [Dentipellis fragilis]|uniref:ribonuclease H n=1 Tax=Dentipellis fragilis TaxID=205917 RepID=A0A4Y9Y617_9AGAM|nr:hypothetical protein EVG20_g8344 [Dentipellis fragilis]
MMVFVRNISERCPGTPTNNRAELIAIIRVFETTQVSRKPLLILTDSSYSIDCFEKWLPGWIRRGFRTSKGGDIKNLGLIQYLAALLKERGMAGQKIKLQHVRGHSGIPGNDGADALAVAGCTLPELPDRDWEALRLEVEERMLKMDMTDAKKVEVTVEEKKVMIVEEEDVDPSIYEDMILDDDELAEMGRTGDFDKY